MMASCHGSSLTDELTRCLVDVESTLVHADLLCRCIGLCQRVGRLQYDLCRHPDGSGLLEFKNQSDGNSDSDFIVESVSILGWPPTTWWPPLPSSCLCSATSTRHCSKSHSWNSLREYPSAPTLASGAAWGDAGLHQHSCLRRWLQLRLAGPLWSSASAFGTTNTRLEISKLYDRCCSYFGFVDDSLDY